MINNGRISHHALGIFDLLTRLFELSLGVALLFCILGIAGIVIRLGCIVLRLAVLILFFCIIKLRHCVINDGVTPYHGALGHEFFKPVNIFLRALLVLIGVNIALGLDADIDIRVVIRRKAVRRDIDIALHAAVSERAGAALHIYIQNAVGKPDDRIFVIRKGIKSLLAVILRKLYCTSDIVF